jgi:hypothetical protein
MYLINNVSVETPTTGRMIPSETNSAPVIIINTKVIPPQADVTLAHY